MKSYIEDPYENGIFTLPIQINSLTTEEFKKVFLNTKIIAYGFSGIFPSWRTFQVASAFLLYFDNKKIVAFGSLMTMVNDSWDEWGSLRLDVHDSIDTVPHGNAQHGDLQIERFNIEPFQITSIHKLVFQDEKMLIDCGIVFSNNANDEIEIAAGYSMSSTVRAPFSTGKFEPDTSEKLFKRVPF